MQFLKFFLFLVISTASHLAFGDEGDSCELRELTRQEAKEFQSESEGYDRIRLRNGMTFELSLIAPTQALQVQLDQLTEAERRKFFKIRHDLLSFTAKTLAFPRVIGTLAWGKKKIKACFSRRAPKQSSAEFLTQIQPSPSGDLSPIAHQGYQAIAEILQINDYRIWNDMSVLIGARSVAWSTYIGLSSGMAIGNWGGLFQRGIELDIGYDFEKEQRFIQIHWFRHSDVQAVWCFEQMLSFGFLRQYRLEPTIQSQEMTQVTLPPFFAYRYGSDTVSSGIALGGNLMYGVAAGMASMGLFELGAAIAAGSQVLSGMSLYWTQVTKSSFLYSHLQIQNPLAKARRAFQKLKNWRQWFAPPVRDCRARLGFPPEDIQ